MSEELYTVVALLARYLFAILGFLIVLRFFLWMLADRMEKRSRSRSLPDAGYIGNLLSSPEERSSRKEDPFPCPGKAYWVPSVPRISVFPATVSGPATFSFPSCRDGDF